MNKIIKTSILTLCIPSIIFANIDINKDVITVKNVNTIIEAKHLAKKLYKYDIYIYLTKKTSVPLYVLYAVNLDKNNVNNILRDIKKISSSSYISSNSRREKLITNDFSSNIFIKLNTKKNEISKKHYNYIVKEDSNVRLEPNLKSKILNIKYKNEEINILKKISTKHNGTWYKTSNGFISYDLVQRQDIKIKPIIMETSKAETKKDILLKIIKKEEVKKKKQVVEKKKTVKPKIVKLAIKVNNKNNKRFFIGIHLGLSKINTTQNNTNGTISLGTKPQTKGLNYGWQLGYKFNNDTFTSFSYTQNNLDDVIFDNYLISFNKSFKNIKYNPYLGIVAGISYIELRKSLINGETQDETGSANAYGIQIGLEENINKDISFFAQYQYLKAKHKTILEVNPASAQLIRDNQSNLNIGIKYLFDY